MPAKFPAESLAIVLSEFSEALVWRIYPPLHAHRQKGSLPAAKSSSSPETGSLTLAYLFIPALAIEFDSPVGEADLLNAVEPGTREAEEISSSDLSNLGASV